ncbi:MAG: glycosyltransferase family 4 protein [Myxococcota bacterium]
MRIAYVVRYWPTLSETFVVREIAELQRRGLHIEVFALGHRRDPHPGESLSELRVHRPPRGAALLAAAFRAIPKPIWSKQAVRVAWAARRLREGRFDRVHAHFAGEAAAFARAAARRADLPFSVTVHANDLFVPRADLRSLLHAARPVITVCAHHAQVMHERYQVQSRVVHCGVDPDRYPLCDPGRSRRFVSVARDVPKKGLDDLVQAMQQVPALLRLVSDGVRLGGPGVLVGPVPAAAVDAILADAMAFVLPCRIAENGDRDGIPVAMMEAMASGIPVVTTGVSGLPELVDDEVGWRVPPNHPRTLAATLREVLADPELRRRKGALARRRIVDRSFTLSAQANGLLAAWELG